MRTFAQEVIIIKRKNIGETDRLLTVVSKDLGKFTIKASGVRKFLSRRCAHVELLNHSKLILYKGRGLPMLQEAEIIESFRSSKSSFNKMIGSYHICELIDSLLPENQRESEVYDLVVETLYKLNALEESDLDNLIYEFELKLLKNLGYLKNDNPNMDRVNLLNLIENTIERRLKTRRIFVPQYLYKQE